MSSEIVRPPEQPATPETDAPLWQRTRDGHVELTGIASWRQAFNLRAIHAADGSADWLRLHWLLLINVMMAIFVGVALLIPFLYVFGWASLGSALFQAYHLVCGQIPSHSYYFFGYQLGLCQRNLAIYGSIFAGTLAYHFVRNRLPESGWRIWLLTMVPMALDGGTQLFGWRESNWELRTLTGVIFGLGVCWFVLPTLQRSASNEPVVSPAR